MKKTSSKNRSLQARFFLGLAAIMFSMGLFFAVSMYLHMRNLLYSEVTDKADLIFSQVDAVQSYVRQTLRPTMFRKLPPGDFLIEAMSSSFVSHQIMKKVKLSGTEHQYRRVAEKPRNPLSQAQGIELELIQLFRRSPGKQHWEGYRTLKGQEYFIKARPVRFGKKCMTCHGRPEDAPKELISRYGDKRGFGHAEGETSAVDMVGVPVATSFNAITEATVGYVMLYLAGMVLVFLVIQFFFNHLVVTNLKRVGGFFRERFGDVADPQLINRLGSGDQIEEMVQGMEELGQQLHDARHQLQEHATTLEQRVTERTQELSREVEERQRDVHLFVRMLGGLNQSTTRKELLNRSLARIAQRFEAEKAYYWCTYSGGQHYSWPNPDVQMDLPEETLLRLVDGHAFFLPDKALIPVTSSQEAVYGVLCLFWRAEESLQSHDQEVLLAVGQQLGIAVENLSALDDLLKQRDTLQSIFEGVSDPMALLDASGRLVAANQAARNLIPPSGEEKSARQNIVQVLLGGDEEHLQKTVGQVIQASRVFSSEVCIPGGRSFLLNLYPLPDSAGRQGRLVAYIRETTTEKRIMAQMQQSERLISVGKLAAGLAHEMNNPLGVILCYADLLQQTLTDRQELIDLEVIIRHTKQAQSVLQELLDFARSGPASKTPLDIGAIVERVTQVFQVQADAKNVSLTMDQKGRLPAVAANPQALEEIFTNLILNSLDAVDGQGGTIKITVSHLASSNEVLIRVADNGPGIDPDHMSSIFDPFFTTKDVGQGTGLGLAVVYGLVTDMGGHIETANQGGAVFSVYLPELGQQEKAGQND